MNTAQRVESYLKDHPQEGSEQVARACDTTEGYVNKCRSRLIKEGKLERMPPELRRAERDLKQYGTDKIETDKKVAEFHWRDAIEPIKAMQDLRRRSSGGQDRAKWAIQTDEEVCILFLGDTQLGSFGTDYEAFVRLTEDIINIPNLYVVLLGDLLQMAIKMRGVYEVHDNVIDPALQMRFLHSWLLDIKHKVICSTWDNHSVMRQEDQAGYSEYAEIFRRHTIYFNGIGHLDIGVGAQEYKLAVSHFFRGRSLLNAGHAPMRYMRHEGQDRDIAAQGDFHVPFIAKYFEGGKHRIALVCGTIQTESGYAKRFFSLYTQSNMPCIALNPHVKMMTPYWSVAEWLSARNQQEVD